MKFRYGTRYLFVTALATALTSIGLASGPTSAVVMAATNVYNSPITTGATSQTIQTGTGETITVTFGVPIQDHVAAGVSGPGGVSPDTYTEQYASVTTSDLGFSETEYGYWEFNGTYAYRIASAPYCTASTGGVTVYCLPYGNGAKNPANMSWDSQAGWGLQNGLYSVMGKVDIYFWGNGAHSESTCGPEPIACGIT
ncbi:MAG: hypothetical protein ACYDEA_11145 [Candidatus Dormibacteria bacterium]